MVRFFTAVAVILSLLVIPPMAGSASHDPFALAFAEIQRHAELSSQVADHGHTHASGLDEEKYANHPHGHNPLDHSHETQNLPPELLIALTSSPQIWRPTASEFKPPNHSSYLERPPKIVSHS